MTGPKVLIADDNEESRYMLESLLSNSGFAALAAANGKEALQLAREHNPELIMSDILMPVMDGYALCRQLKADERLKRIPFVFYSATYTDERDVEFGLGLGADRFLKKPEEPDIILQVLRELLGMAETVREPSFLGEEMEFFRQHNAVLFRKLEKKMADLVDANAALQREIRERQLAEAALVRAKEAAETANLAKRKFLMNMSHELRTPMTGVLGAIEVARRGSLSDEQRELLGMAVNSGKRLVRIIGDILDLTRIDADMLPLEKQEFIPADCAAAIHDIFIPEAKLKGIELFLVPAPDLPCRVLGDKTRLQQVLGNLVGNAVKFTERGKVEILVGTGEKTADGKQEIIFTVTDTGIGIPEEKKGIIFDSFTQADDSTTRRFGGAGLGLAISRELVTRMGGSIGFESEEGKGSRFFFAIPFPVLCEETDAELEAGRKEATPV